MGAIIGLVLTGLAVYVAILAVVPTVSYVTRPTAGAESWINSTCDVFVTLSHSELLQYVKFGPGAEMNPNLTRHLPNETVSVHPQTLYRTLKRLSLLQWPFTGNATAEELLITLLRYLTSPVTQVESDCHVDASYDPVNQCCFVSCPTWKWLTRAEEMGDDVWFYINLVLSIVLVFVSTTTVVATKTKRRFPLIMIAWYLCLAASALNFSELVSRAMGRNNLMCCGSKDLFEAISSNCIYAIVYVIFYQFFFLVFTAWSALMAVNVVIIGRPHLADSFFVHLNRIHATELLLGWGIPAFLSILPFAIKGKNAYSNFAGICPTCFLRDRDLEYYTSVLPNQIFEILLGVVMGCIAIIKERKLRDRKKLMNEASGIYRQNVDDLKRIQRHLALIIGTIVCVGLCPTVYVSVVLANNGEIGEKIDKYLECILINSGEETCEHGAYTHYSMMFYFVLNRLYHTLLSIGLMFVLFLTKDAQLLWKKMFASCLVACARGCRVTAPADSSAKEHGTVNTVVESNSKDNLKQ